jgi:hypothetical protein
MLLIGTETLTHSINFLLPMCTFSSTDAGPKVWTPADRDLALESVDSVANTGEQDTVNDAAFLLGTDVVDDEDLMTLPFATLSVRLLYSLPLGVNSSSVSSIVMDLETVAGIYVLDPGDRHPSFDAERDGELEQQSDLLLLLRRLLHSIHHLLFPQHNELHFVTAESESEIFLHALRHPGSIGYVLMDEDEFDPGLHVRMMP